MFTPSLVTIVATAILSILYFFFRFIFSNGDANKLPGPPRQSFFHGKGSLIPVFIQQLIFDEPRQSKTSLWPTHALMAYRQRKKIRQGLSRLWVPMGILHCFPPDFDAHQSPFFRISTGSILPMPRRCTTCTTSS